MQPLAFVDLETTGATIAADRITEIGVVEVDEDGVREWSQLVNPQTPIPAFVQRLTGITDAMVADAPTFAEVADALHERLQGRLFIAHNARFDYGFLKHEFGRLGRDFRATVLCTVKLSRRLFPQHHRHSLDSLVERHGLTASGRHRALADAQLIHQFWTRIHADLPAEQIDAAVLKLTARPALPAHLDADLADMLPSGPGVYLFYGVDDRPLWVGKASQLRKRVLAHFAADRPASSREAGLVQQVRRIDWIETAGEIGAALREAALLGSLQPAYNRRVRRDSDLCAWRLVEAGEAFRPQLVFARDGDFAGQEGLHGLFRTPRDAQRSLQGLADEHGLCRAVLGLEQVPPGQPCFARQAQKCRGACVGREAISFHNARLMAALARMRLQAWPFAGAALIEEGAEMHVIDRWRYLGSAGSRVAAEALLDGGRPDFDENVYRILLKARSRMRPLA